MGQRRARVVVAGAGPAGLAAAARLLERGGERVHVRVCTLGHHLGGKASSWRDSEGRLIDHGQHVFMGWYRELRALLGRAGIDVDACLVSNQGRTRFYEPRDGRVHELALARNPLVVLLRSLGYSGLTAAEKLNVTAFVLRSFGAIFGMEDIEHLDDVCFTAWALDQGLAPSIVRTSAFHASRDAQLNWPGEISAYLMLQQMRVIGRDYRTTEYFLCDGGMSERFWTPLLQYVARLGGELELMRQLTGLRWDGDRLTAAVFQEPDPAGHDKPEHPPGRSVYEGGVPSKPDTTVVDDEVDWLISTLPAEAFQQLNAGDDALWSIPTFARLRNLRSVDPLALQIWHREPLTERWDGVHAGLEGPLRYVIDNKRVIREYRHSPRYGSVLYFVGQETGYEHLSDDDLLTLCLDNVAHLPGFERIDRRGIMHWRVVRHRAFHKSYFLTEPGTLRFRPGTRTPLKNLMMAGDWVRGELDFPCMETATRSGIAAADAVLDDLFEGAWAA